jgi:hypothetical protein
MVRFNQTKIHVTSVESPELIIENDETPSSIEQEDADNRAYRDHLIADISQKRLLAALLIFFFAVLSLTIFDLINPSSI